MRNLILLFCILLLNFGCKKSSKNTLEEVSEELPPELSATPQSANIGLVESFLFTIEGGVKPFSIDTNGLGTMNQNGLFFGTHPGSGTISIEDAIGQSVSVSVTVGTAGPSISPGYIVLCNGELFTPVASGGTPPYTWTISGDGSINSSTGEYTPPALGGAAMIEVMDSNSLTGQAVYLSKECPTTNLVAWYRPEDLVSLSDGSPVSSWLDNSGNGNTLTAIGGQEPSYLKDTSNQYPGVYFDGTNQYLKSAGYMGDLNDFDIFVVFKFDDTSPASNGQSVFSHSGSFASSASADNVLSRFFLVDGIYSLMYERNSGTVSSFNYYNIHASRFLRLSRSGTTLYMYTNGTTPSVGSGAANLPNGGGNGLFYLGSTDGTTGFYKGSISEIFIYSEYLGTAEKNKVLNYLNSKY